MADKDYMALRPPTKVFSVLRFVDLHVLVHGLGLWFWWWNWYMMVMREEARIVGMAKRVFGRFGHWLAYWVEFEFVVRFGWIEVVGRQELWIAYLAIAFVRGFAWVGAGFGVSFQLVGEAWKVVLGKLPM
jgi:hypothetical protein